MGTILEVANRLKESEFFQIKGKLKVNFIGKKENAETYAMAEVMLVENKIQYQVRGTAEFGDNSLIIGTLSNEVNIPYTDITFFDNGLNEEEFNRLVALPSTEWGCK